IADRADVAQRDVHDTGLHRVADARHHRRQLICNGYRVEVHAAAHADVARAPKDDRALGVLLGEGGVGPAHEPTLPRRVVEWRRGIDDALPGDRPREPELAVDPQADVGRSRLAIAARHFDVVDTGIAAPRGVGDRVT